MKVEFNESYRLEDYLEEIGIKPVKLDITDFIIKNANIFVYGRDIYLVHHGIVDFNIQFYVQSPDKLYKSFTFEKEHDLNHYFDYGHTNVDYSKTLLEKWLTTEL